MSLLYDIFVLLEYKEFGDGGRIFGIERLFCEYGVVGVSFSFGVRIAGLFEDSLKVTKGFWYFKLNFFF